MQPLRMFVFFLLLPLCSQAQNLTPTKSDFKASAQSVIKQSSNWKATIDQVKTDDLDVKFAIGKEIEKAKEIALLNYNMTISWARRVQTDESLYAEVNYFSQLQSFQSSVDNLSSILGTFTMNSVKDQKKANDWSYALTELSTGPINIAWQTGMVYTLDHIQRSEALCKSK
ncbi:hypothetical protein [Edaphobacter flagellatus]|uniref:hypothetical protein n=1 Tax=Edaphobacter flagellatus TaxID=1933044 RepID=UPI0021B1EC8C|nr:hypothetical protein [Edaphobacter flagellatus]